jgi:hypothetical protein
MGGGVISDGDCNNVHASALTQVLIPSCQTIVEGGKEFSTKDDSKYCLVTGPKCLSPIR